MRFIDLAIVVGWAAFWICWLAASIDVTAGRMAGLFPDTYPVYKRSTKMLIPFIF